MRQLQCTHCDSFALMRVKRRALTRLRFPHSRQYRCHECTAMLLVNNHGEVIHSKKSKIV